MKSHSVSHNVCYETLSTYYGKPIKGWNVKPSDIVYDSRVDDFAFVVRVLGSQIDLCFPSLHNAECIVTSDFSDKLFIQRDAFLVRNGIVRSGVSVLISSYASNLPCTVLKVDYKSRRVFVRPNEGVSHVFGFWEDLDDVVCFK